ncbi:acyltransferase family protein [Pseudoduganella sp. FT25W]|uniref:Acyltransferase family protein n=2 Tax=Duganella alba TaxID=2666081 RepID=A0A6L5QQI6_9BURK|nr:acyltransferase family protein [Duganella alba]MRX19240.1 acyltransferase family protein [Duganella alba]
MKAGAMPPQATSSELNMSQSATAAPTAPAAHMAYRPDIDGLRTLAVLPVVLFHAGFTALSGGFVGVDVFFVISGFLITSIIAADIDKQRFSIVDFYERRIRRIFPALFAMLTVALVFAGLMFIPADFRQFGKSFISSSLFFSNLMFWSEGGYFDFDAELKPLLHTWSLSVEEQFYIFFPPLLYLLKTRVRRWRACIVGLFLASLAAAAWMAYRDHDTAFYVPLYRVWELLTGSIIALAILPPAAATPRRGRELLAAAGIVMILGASLFYTSSVVFPGLSALLPCLGAGLLIYYGRDTAAGRLLGSAPLVGIGKISYSLYLWHWPVIVFYRYWLGRAFTLPEQVLVIGLSFLLAWLSYRYIETPFRLRRAGGPRKVLFAQGAVATMLTVGIGGLIYLANGVPQRMPDNVLRLASSANDINPMRQQCDRRSVPQVQQGDVCSIGPDNVAPSFAVMGDSFGDAFMPGVAALAEERGQRGLVLTASGCLAMLDVVDASSKRVSNCKAFIQASIDLIKHTPSIQRVLLIGRWPSAAEGRRFGAFMADGMFITDDQSTSVGYEENKRVFTRRWEATIAALNPRQVYIAAYIPEQRIHVPRELALCTYFGHPCPAGVSRSDFEQRQAYVRQVFESLERAHKAQILDVGSKLCGKEFCPLYAQHTSLYVDDNHISRSAALMLREVLAPAVAPAAPGAQAAPVHLAEGQAAPAARR